MRTAKDRIITGSSLGFILAAVATNTASGQSTLVLQPLQAEAVSSAELLPEIIGVSKQSLQPNQATLPKGEGGHVIQVGATNPASPPVVSNNISNLPVQLVPLQKKSELTSTPVSYSLTPMVPVPNQSEIRRTKISVASMTSDVPDPSTLFQQLETLPAQQIPAEQLGNSRTEVGEYGIQYWTGTAYCWKSPAFCHSPLYFEQPNLERYGQGLGTPFNSIVSPLRFSQQVLTLPVAVMITPPWTKECTLGNHRPGDCAPHQGRPTAH